MTDLEELVARKQFVAFRKEWERARDADALPRRRDITLRQFATFISDMIVLERKGPGDYRYCQAGEEVKGRLAMKDTGVNFFEFLHPDILEVSKDWWGCLLDAPCGGVISYSIEYPSGALRHAATMLLPVRRDNGSRDQLIGMTQVLGERYLTNAGERILIGEHFAEGIHIDVGYGVPKSTGQPYRHAPSPMFLKSS